MTKPRLAKVRALFYVFKHTTKRGRAYFDTASFECTEATYECSPAAKSLLTGRIIQPWMPSRGLQK